ncbi:hypothetical protein KSP39_PZI016733 [Platanthera zijinensis]|uniref:DUF7036 domain-containing protein n=1 Tax=Platanthera zijinensis TaxID=2320716 RepID=A0AAP0B7U3_9ASPA
MYGEPGERLTMGLNLWVQPSLTEPAGQGLNQAGSAPLEGPAGPSMPGYIYIRAAPFWGVMKNVISFGSIFPARVQYIFSAVLWFALHCGRAEIQASFILQRPFSLITSHAKRLEYDIFEEIGIPNTKVSIISIHPASSINCTFVSFGMLPEPRHACISLPALSLLRSSLIELVLQKINLTLTPIFGEALFFEENMKEAEGPAENIYVQMTNVDGSTVAPPVTLQASILSDYGTVALLPNRLRQLADTVIGFREQNLGLNHSVFGEVKSVVLSSYLNNLISSSEPPTPSPSLSPSPSPSDHRIDSYSSNSAAPNPSFYHEYKLRGRSPQSVHKVFYDSTLVVQDKESIEASTFKDA